jgi:hypothetical protein
LYTPCILDCALRFSNKNFYLLIKKKTIVAHFPLLGLLRVRPIQVIVRPISVVSVVTWLASC